MQKDEQKRTHPDADLYEGKRKNMKSPLTTLCYIEKDDQYLMLHRVSKKNDVNKDKWIGIGGHFEEGESPEECLLREAKEETGLTLTSWKFRGIVTFVADEWPPEYMCLFTADGFEGEMISCSEGNLEWVPKEDVVNLNLWEGDKIFLKLLAEDAPFFSMKLKYKGDVLVHASVDGKELELFDICDEYGNPTGRITERSVAHSTGTRHRTAHVWVVRTTDTGKTEVLLQKRSARKDSYPLCYDISAAGHTKAGDECEAAAYRELEEELGIQALPGELKFVDFYDMGDVKRIFHGKPFHEREISAVYVYDRPVEISQIVLQESEVESVRWMELEVCLDRVRNNDPEICTQLGELELLNRYLGGQIG